MARSLRIFEAMRRLALSLLLSLLSLLSSACTGMLHGVVHVDAHGVATHHGAAETSSTQATGTLHAEVRVEFFDVDLTGAEDVVFVLDRSGSMATPAPGVNGRQLGMDETASALTGIGLWAANAASGNQIPSKMDMAKLELLEALEAMPDGTRVNVIFFDTTVSTFAPGLVALDPHSRAHLIDFIRAIEEGGSTAAVPALETAYAMNLRHVVLLSDGLANSGGGADRLLERARVEMRRGVRFDTVGLGFDQNGAVMAALAHESGGTNVMR